MSKHLQKIAREKARWQLSCDSGRDRYTEALRAAVEAGHTYPEIGEAAGITRQAVWNMLNDYRTGDKT